MKYDAQIGEFKTKLAEAKKILVALPSNVNNDKMAGSLALYLSLKQSGKEVAIISETEIRVSQSVLFGIGDVKKELPEGSSGNFILGLDGVVVDGKVPALVDLNWYPEGSTLNLVFNVVPGEKFEPINITHHYDSASFDLIIVIGAPTLAQLGNVYNNNLEKFTDTPKVNIDNSNSNNLYGAVNIIDAGVPVSEMIMHILQGMSLPQDPDIATNIITGLYDVTRGLTSNTSADTFLMIGEAMKMGGKVLRTTGQPQAAQASQSGGDNRQSSGRDQQRRNDQPRNDQRDQSQSNQNQQNTQPKQNRPDNRNQQSPRQDQSTRNDDQPVGEILQPFKEDLEPAVSPRETTPVADIPTDPAPDPVVVPVEPQSVEETNSDVDQKIEDAEVTVADSAVVAPKPQNETPSGEQVQSTSGESTNPAPDWLTPKIFSGKGLG